MSSSYTVLWIGFRHAGHISLCIDSFVFMCVLYFVFSYCIIMTRRGGPHGTEAQSSGTYWLLVLWHCWFALLTRKNPSPIWPIMCLVGRQPSFQPFIVCPSICLTQSPVFCGGSSLKLGTNIHHVSGHCWKDFQGQRSKVKVKTRPNLTYTSRGIYFVSVASKLSFLFKGCNMQIIYCLSHLLRDSALRLKEVVVK